MIGKDVRLKRLFKQSRTFILPMDHGITIGPVEGLKDIISVIDKVQSKIDAVVVHKGLVRQISNFIEPNKLELIVHLSASTSLSPEPNKKELITSVEHAIRVGASAVSVHVNLGSKNDSEMLKDFGIVAETCDTWGMPLLAMMYVRDATKENECEPIKIQHAVRVAEEIGADIVKVNYTGSSESFSEIVNSVKIPVIIAGGPKMSSDTELIETIKGAISVGAKGVAIGRNIFQSLDPLELSTKIAYIIRGN